MTLNVFALTSMLYWPDKKFPTSHELCKAVTLTLAYLPNFRLERQEQDRAVIYVISRENIELGRMIVDIDLESSYGMKFTIPDRMNFKQGVTDDEWRLKREFEEICVKVAQRAKKLKMDRLEKEARASPTGSAHPEPGVGGDDLVIPGRLFDQKAMRQYYKDYSPKSARKIIASLPGAQQEAKHQDETLTVTRLANKAGFSVESTSRYLTAIKKAGYDTLLGVRLPGR